jgi:hypothetical protein
MMGPKPFVLMPRGLHTPNMLPDTSVLPPQATL